MSIQIEKPGVLATLQDSGRKGYGRFGISMSGAMDQLAHRLANWLVGNTEDEATIEITLSGFLAVVQADMWVAVTGGDLQAFVNGQELPMWRPVYLRQGSLLSFKKPISGCRAYLAAAGGWQAASVLGSHSTYVRAEIGGLSGRALQAGDIVKVRKAQQPSNPEASILSVYSNHTSINSWDYTSLSSVRWRVSSAWLPNYAKQPVIRILPGQQWLDFDQETRQILLDTMYRVTPQSDRMGYRLSGAELHTLQPQQYISEAVAHGTIQVPPDGQPIVLMADRQTLGGYAKIAQVISLDLPLIAQLAPGDKVRFQLVSLEEAQQLYIDWVKELRMLHRMINMRLQQMVQT